MKRLVQAPNLAIATLWSDLLVEAGIRTSLQRVFTSGLAGEIPPDQALPEVWVQDDGQWERARELLDALAHCEQRRWFCGACHELVEGPFETCWNCSAPMPAQA